MAPHGSRLPGPHLCGLLSETIGEEKARQVVHDDARGLELDLEAGLSSAEALQILELVAAVPGLVGITARFVKSRLHLTMVASTGGA